MKDKFQYRAKQTAFYSCPCCGWEWYETRPAYCHNCEVKLTYEPINKIKKDMKTAELNDYLMYNGTLHKVTGIMTGKTIIMEPIIEDTDKQFLRGHAAGGPVYILEHCNNFQEGAEPVGTLGEDCLKPKAKKP